MATFKTSISLKKKKQQKESFKKFHLGQKQKSQPM